MKRYLALFLALALLAALVLTGCQNVADPDDEDGSRPERNEQDKDQGELSLEDYDGADGYALVEQIYSDTDRIIRPYEDEDGQIEHDEDILTESSMKVYDWALELVDAGIIEAATYCEDSYTVAFFLNDGTTSLYVPKIAGAYSGSGEEFSVLSVVGVGSVSNAFQTTVDQGGSVKSAEYIYDNVEECTEHIRYDSSNNIAELRLLLGGLGGSNTRVIFWRGHGDIYEHPDGTRMLALITSAEVSDRTEELYYDDRHSDDGTPATLATAGDHYAVNTYFFDTYLNRVDGGLFYCGSCYGGADGGAMAEVILSKGFEAYCGASSEIMISYSDKLMYSMAQNLTEVNDQGDYPTAAEALDAAMAEHGETDFWGTRMLLGTKGEFRLLDGGYKDAYAEVLRNNISSDGYGGFQLVYIDDDDIPELAISTGQWHAAGVTLYTYYDGRAVEIGTFGGYGCMEYGSRKDLFRSWYEGMGMAVEVYYSLAEGQACVLRTFEKLLSMEDFETYTYYVDNEETTQTVYGKELDAFTAGHTFSMISYENCASITENNIQKMLEDISGFVELG